MSKAFWQGHSIKPAQTPPAKKPGLVKREQELANAEDVRTHARRRFAGEYGEMPRVVDVAVNRDLGEAADNVDKARNALDRQRRVKP